MYLAIAVNHAEDHAADSDLTADGVPETIGVQNAGSVQGRV